MEKIFVFQTTQFDFELINHIRILRKSKGFTKEDLSLAMGVTRTFVGNVESFTQRHKYSTRHITLLAHAFGYKNISEMMKFPTPEYDKIKVTVKQTMNESGTKSLFSVVLKIEALE